MAELGFREITGDRGENSRIKVQNVGVDSTEHNMRLPHSAFRGQTPDEMYYGTGDRIPEELEAAKKSARQSRMKLNRATSCQMCQPSELIAN